MAHQNLLLAPTFSDVVAVREARGKRCLASNRPLVAVDGYDSLVGDRGVMSSEAERQLGALARALFRCPTRSTLDEAMRALEQGSAVRVLTAVTALRGQTNRLLLVRGASALRAAAGVPEVDQDVCRLRVPPAGGIA